MLGLAQRARKLTFGMDATLSAEKRGKLKAVILSSDISENAKRKIESNIDGEKIAISGTVSKDAFGELFKRMELGIIGIVDASFAKAIRENLR